MSWVVTLTLASHPEQEFLLEDDSRLFRRAKVPRARKLLHLAKQPHQPETSPATRAMFPCMGPSLPPGNFLLFDPGFGQCSETATVLSPF